MAHDHHGAGTEAGQGGHGPGGARAHGHDHAHGPGHNHAHGEHLASHLHGDDGSEALAALAEQFLDGFRQAADKTAYLRLTGIPFEIADEAGGPSLKLVDVVATTAWQVGTASPGFGTRELAYLPFPGAMVRERTNVALVYVSLARRVDRDLREVLREHAAMAAR
ncbi:MAG: hypothetical protein ACFBWO_09420 [Paracoccaceae bacterium]